jgi:anti-anti-sigma factor
MGVKRHVERSGRVAVVEPRGMLLGDEETIRFDRHVRELLESAVQVVIVDLSRVEYVGTAAIGLIQEKHLLAQSKGATLALCNVNRRTLDTFRVLWMDRVWKIFGTRKDAIESLDSR